MASLHALELTHDELSIILDGLAQLEIWARASASRIKDRDNPERVKEYGYVQALIARVEEAQQHDQ